MLKRLIQKDSIEFDASTAAALRKLAFILLTLVLFITTTYALPILTRFRPWVPGEAVPLARLFQPYDSSLLPAFAEAAALAAPDQDANRRKSRERESKVKDKAGSPAARTRIAPEEIEGLTQQIEDPEGRALAPFYQALLRTAERRSKAITRVAHFGDSAVAADSITVTVRRRMQKRFGDAGHGFILIARGQMHYYHMDIRHRASDDWQLYPIVLLSLGTDWYGYGGVQFRSAPGSWARFATSDRGEVGGRASRFEIFYQIYPGGGKLIAKLDEQPPVAIDTRGPQKQDAWFTLETSDGPHKLSLRTDGRAPVRLYGVALERETPGVVYDSLGMVGGRAERLLAFEREHIQGQLDHRDPDLLILAFGGNEADNRWLDIARYERNLRKVVKHLVVQGNRPACLLFAPLDQAERDERGEIRTIAKLPEIVETQRRVARAQGCAFFDTYQAMGGKDAMKRWYRQRPRLATSDFRHATAAGYERIGDMFYKAILKGFADHLSKGKAAGGSKQPKTSDLPNPKGSN
ncbi:MAG: hypothetical protein JXA30_15730 [Deltaproteobacteria bacterium]|nr:hypothetical protein [Deltaproteobacteria bacterium]